ncbi:AAA family ATPase [Methylobacterium sp. J-090]|uniref:AAA family ATPase n=1 Tax=Methylobacterium sp. J-090 TaxID=2836666 RepID=UPI001FBAF2F9|nr:AAA family ATPase [Methylobacterium sp. J-090]MCJ2083203.1 ATP-binding protein [Methylobacterium sp. J-090]
MTFEIKIPFKPSDHKLRIELGASVIIVGPNGGGKSRLAAHIERELGSSSHRISAQRVLALKPDVAKISGRVAISKLRTGVDQENVNLRRANRWMNGDTLTLLNDFDYLIQVLFADQSKVSLQTHKEFKNGGLQVAADTMFEKLERIWNDLIPHRRLEIKGDDIVVYPRDSEIWYSASRLSDGERSMFYIIGQVLVAQERSVLIFDEPELHLHKSIMGKLWDHLETARPDCAFVLITHDLDFAASRAGKKFVISSYEPGNGWDLDEVPQDTGFTEEVTTIILGSRRPILFVEGAETSLDKMIYRACFPGWTIISQQSCGHVIHAVSVMRNNHKFTRINCRGIVDADDHDPAYLLDRGVAVLPVSEIENLLLLPEVSRAILIYEGYVGVNLELQLERLMNAVFARATEKGAIDRVVATHCKRRVDRLIKNIDWAGALTIEQISSGFEHHIKTIDINSIGLQIRQKIEASIADRDLKGFLSVYDDKGLLTIAATHLKNTNQNSFKDWLGRVLSNNAVPSITTAIQQVLPVI